MPIYLRNSIGSYLSDRAITYRVEGEMKLKKPANRGVPQGSVLGPLLWNLGFNSVLETAVPTGLQIICYADDTLIIAGERTWTRTLRLVEVGVAAVIAEIRRLGLEVAAHKTEAIWIHDLSRSRRPPQT